MDARVIESTRKNYTAATVREMRRHLEEGVRQPKTIAAARRVARTVPERDDLAIAEALLAWTKKKLHYVRDPWWMETLGGLDWLRKVKACDCEEQSIWFAAHAEAVGLRTRFCTVSVKHPRQEFDHVYVQVFIPKLGWQGADPTVRSSRIGWEPPVVQRKVCWERGGKQVTLQGFDYGDDQSLNNTVWHGVRGLNGPSGEVMDDTYEDDRARLSDERGGIFDTVKKAPDPRTTPKRGQSVRRMADAAKKRPGFLARLFARVRPPRPTRPELPSRPKAGEFVRLKDRPDMPMRDMPVAAGDRPQGIPGRPPTRPSPFGRKVQPAPKAGPISREYNPFQGGKQKPKPWPPRPEPFLGDRRSLRAAAIQAKRKNPREFRKLWRLKRTNPRLYYAKVHQLARDTKARKITIDSVKHERRPGFESGFPINTVGRPPARPEPATPGRPRPEPATPDANGMVRTTGPIVKPLRPAFLPTDRFPPKKPIEIPTPSNQVKASPGEREMGRERRRKHRRRKAKSKAAKVRAKTLKETKLKASVSHELTKAKSGGWPTVKRWFRRRMVRVRSDVVAAGMKRPSDLLDKRARGGLFVGRQTTNPMVTDQHGTKNWKEKEGWVLIDPDEYALLLPIIEDHYAAVIKAGTLMGLKSGEIDPDYAAADAHAQALYMVRMTAQPVLVSSEVEVAATDAAAVTQSPHEVEAIPGPPRAEEQYGKTFTAEQVRRGFDARTIPKATVWDQYGGLERAEWPGSQFDNLALKEGFPANEFMDQGQEAFGSDLDIIPLGAEKILWGEADDEHVGDLDDEAFPESYVPGRSFKYVEHRPPGMSPAANPAPDIRTPAGMSDYGSWGEDEQALYDESVGMGILGIILAAATTIYSGNQQRIAASRARDRAKEEAARQQRILDEEMAEEDARIAEATARRARERTARLAREAAEERAILAADARDARRLKDERTRLALEKTQAAETRAETFKSRVPVIAGATAGAAALAGGAWWFMRR